MMILYKVDAFVDRDSRRQVRATSVRMGRIRYSGETTAKKTEKMREVQLVVKGKDSVFL
jgi:hypothetical protein